jgi:hypothetical protein
LPLILQRARQTQPSFKALQIRIADAYHGKSNESVATLVRELNALTAPWDDAQTLARSAK